MPSGRCFAVAALLLAATLGACGGGDEPEPLVVACAASLRELATDAAGAFAAERGCAVPVVTTEASSTLARQIAAGAAIDVFLSADAESVERAGDRVSQGTNRSFLSNELVLAVRSDAEDASAGPVELAATEGLLGLAGEEVPAGRYARAYLAHLGVAGAFAGRTALGSNVRATLALLESGAVDAAFVFRTDAALSSAFRVVHVAPREVVRVAYFAAAVVDERGAAHPDAEAFLAFLGGAEFQRLASSRGFAAP